MSTKPRKSRKLASRLDLHIENEILLDEENWDFTEVNTRYLLHNLHPYPAKFIPQIPKRAIERWTRPGDLVVDPFCGSGTTLLESALAGRNSIGIDNNAVATLVAKAKVANYDEHDFKVLQKLTSNVEDNCKLGISLDSFNESKSFIPNYPNRDKWFDTLALRDLAWLKSKISKIDEPAKLLALAVFSSLMIQASHQDSDTRYAAVERKYVKGSALRRWIQRMKSTIENARQTSYLVKPSKHIVHTADSRNLSFIDDNSVKLIITSPPYLNAYDYHKYHRHRLHWIDGDVIFARDLEIGKHDTFTRPNANPELFFNDFRKCISEWYRILQPKGRILIVIGDAIVNKHFIPVGDALWNIGSEFNLESEKRWIRNLAQTRKSFNQDARIKREHLLLFKK